MAEAGILEGVRVLDLSSQIAGPVAAMLLAEAGADVVKIEPPRGDPTRARPGFAVWNRSKRSAVLDLEREADRRHLEALLAGADVLVHDRTAAEARRLGLDAPSLAARFPALLVCAVPGYPAGHPDADRPGHDTLVLARAGLMDEQKGHRDGPIFLRFPLASWGAAWLAAAAVVARLIDRGRTGRAGAAGSSLLQGALVPMTMHWARAERPSPSFAYGLPKDVAASLFECADGVWLHVMRGPEQTPLMRAALDEMGPDRVAALNADGPSVQTLANFGAMRAAFLERPHREWLEDLWANDIPVQPATPLGEIYFDEQARANRYVIEIDDPTWGRTQQPGHPFTTDPPPRVRGPAPALGAHTREVLGEAAAAPKAAAREAPATARGAPAGDSPLSGLKVLDFGNFLAGPLAPMLLADLGAEVIKIESTAGDQMRNVERVFDGCQRGKRGVALQLKHPSARAVLERLVRWCDVVHHNLRMPAARRLGIDYESLRAVNPDVVYCHVSSYGPVGPRADWPGFDQLFQAQAGWEVEGAGEGNPPMWHRFGMMDHQCALASLLATLLGVYRRDRTGRGQFVAASLLGASILTISETLVLPDGSLAPYPRLDARQTGVSPENRIYECEDGWVAVVAPSAEALRDAAGGESVAALETRFASLKCDEALARLERGGVAAEPVRRDRMNAFFDHPAHEALHLVARYPHARYGRTEQIGTLFELGELAPRLDRAAPVLGQHTREVLLELGFDAAAIGELAAAGAVAGPEL